MMKRSGIPAKDKKGIVLVELIFTIVIISIVAVFTMTFLFNLYDKLSNEYTNEINKIETSSTNILLDKIFAEALNISISSNTITFYKNETSLFNLGHYSRFVDLNNTDTTKSSIYSPNTKAEQLLDYHITFDNLNFYSIKNDSNGNIINLDDENGKTIKEHYKIISTNHKITYFENSLYYNEDLLLENITKCTFFLQADTIIINIIKDDIPIILSYKIKTTI